VLCTLGPCQAQLGRGGKRKITPLASNYAMITVYILLDK
jgi:hypothetical protein